MLRSEDVEALTGLGLSVLQAKVYLALADLGKATVKAISKTADVARQDMYRLISELQEMGMVEKIITTPTEFKALPMQEAVTILLHRRDKESSKAAAKAMELLERRRKENANAPLQEGSQFVMIPEKEALILRLEKAFEAAQVSVDNICSWKRFSQGIEIMGPSLEKALMKGVEVSCVVEKPSNIALPSGMLRHLLEYPNFKIRTCSVPPVSVMGIVDKKEIYLATSIEGGAAESPALWTTNRSFIVLSLNYFESSWTEATESLYAPKSRKSRVRAEVTEKTVEQLQSPFNG